MARLPSLKLLIFSILIIDFCLVSSIFARPNTEIRGNIIKSISPTTQRGESFLLIKGSFHPEQLSNISINKSEGSTNFTVTVPNSLIDPERITAPSIRFNPKSPISAIQIVESVKGEGDRGVFTVDLIVEAKDNLVPELVKPITSSVIKIAINSTAKVQQKLNQRQEKEVAIRQKKEIEKKKIEVRIQAKDTISEILKHYHKPSIMQISILNASGYAKRAYQLSVFLGKLKKEYIEERLGIKMEIVNISNARNKNFSQSTIYFRENYLKTALLLAKLIKGEQRIVPMNDKREKRGIDIEIYLGRDYK